VMGWLPLLGVILILAAGAALLIPITVKIREAAARTQSISNLTNICLAAHGFHDANKRLPFNGTKPAEANDFRSGSWAFQITCYLDSSPMFSKAPRNVG